jgi:hypothetical protein
VLDAQDTPFNIAVENGGPDGAGVLCMPQVLPLKRSTRAPRLVQAAIVHAPGAAHEMPLTWRMKPPARFGVGWIDHAAPFHCSARVTLTKLLLM